MLKHKKTGILVNKPELKALFHKIGGKAGLNKILKTFYEKMAKDILIGFFFDGKDLDFIASQQQSFLMKAMGAATSYNGNPPAKAHSQLPPILVGHFDRRLKLLEETLKEFGLCEQDIKVWIGFENAFRDGIVTSAK
jgi:truncated hemoglobin YjbI